MRFCVMNEKREVVCYLMPGEFQDLLIHDRGKSDRELTHAVCSVDVESFGLYFYVTKDDVDWLMKQRDRN